MPAPFTVVAADFLEETSVEGPVLNDIAKIVLARAMDESALGPYLADTDAFLLFHDIPHLGAATFQRAPKCKCVVRAGVGYNNVDLKAASEHGVIVCNVPDYGTEEVADHAIMFLLAVARRLVPSRRDPHGRLGLQDGGSAALDCSDRAFGVVGCGRIGTATALRAKALGLDVVFFDPFQPSGLDKALGIRRAYSLLELLGQSHFVSLHCYLDDSTHRLIDAQALAAMRPGAILINTARGPVVAEEDLLDALDSGHLSGAALDVIETGRSSRPPQPPEGDPHRALGVLQRGRGFHRIADQGGPGGPAHLHGQPPRNRSRFDGQKGR